MLATRLLCSVVLVGLCAGPSPLVAQDQPRKVSEMLKLPTPEEIAQLPPDGGEEFNRLIHESSPYLLQHARNPVDWYPWGEEAFKEAERRDVPVFLSVGYATCHWCHVMERESFESEEMAALMNERFVCIKVDREERPDVDHIYMRAVQTMTGRGGWPMSVFMTPDGRPFWGGTYFPPEDRHGHPGFGRILTTLSELWRQDREKLLAGAEELTRLIQAQRPGPEAAIKLDAETLQVGLGQYAAQFDLEHGGFGRAPKFPRPHSLLFLLRRHQATEDARARTMVEDTLEHMLKGGVYDHLGGGLHRYSTDREWLVPHFEKMLYDQALLVRALVETWLVTQDPLYRRGAEDVIRYVLRDLTAPGGAFYSAEDADSEGVEGKFYLWTYAELVEVLGEEDGAFLASVYGATEAGNYHEEATGEATGENILHLPELLSAQAGKLEISEAALRERLAGLKEQLFQVRSRRIRPLLDDKILVDWNGLMIASLAYAGRSLQQPEYVAAAKQAAGFLLETALDGDVLLHRIRNDQAGIQGFLDDYAFLAWGLLELYEATLERRWLEAAHRLATGMVERFWDEEGGGFFFRPAADQALVARTKEAYDGAVPSGNAVATFVLLRLGHLTAAEELLGYGDRCLQAFSADIKGAPIAHPFWLMGLDFQLGPRREVVLAGPPTDPAFAALQAEVYRRYLPRTVLAGQPGGEEGVAVAALIPYLAEQQAVEGRPTAYVCQDYACQVPTTVPEELGRQLDGE